MQPVTSICFSHCLQLVPKLKQPDGVSYRTAELYEQFIRSYYCQRFCLITASSKKSDTTTPKKDVFQDIHTEIKHQSLLHLISCLQIASKLEDGYKVKSHTNFARLRYKFISLCRWLQFTMQLTFFMNAKDPAILPPL